MAEPLARAVYYMVVSILGDAFVIVHGDQEAVAADDCDGVRRHATTRKLKRLLRRAIPSRSPILDVWGAQAPPCGHLRAGVNKR